MKINQSVTLPKKKHPIILIGAGGIVKDAHLPAYKKSGFTVDAIFDIDYEKAHSVALEYGIKNVFKTIKEAIEFSMKGKYLFDIAVPASEIIKVLELLPGSAHVLIQKPMGENLLEAEAILKICRGKGLYASVNFQLRYAPFVLAAKDLIENGVIGEPHDFDLKLNVYTPWHLWDFLKELPRVEILYHSIHYIDLIRSFLGSPERVYAKTTIHPSYKELAATRTHIIMDYGEYKKVDIDTNHGHGYGVKHQESYFKIEGTKGAIYIRIGLSLDYPIGMPDTFEYAIRNEKGTFEWHGLSLEGTWFPDAFIGTMAEAQKRMVDETYKVPTDVEDALFTMKVVEAAYLSSEEGGVRIG